MIIMADQQHTGGAYTSWNEELRKKYIDVISDARIKLKQIPRWEGSGLVLKSEVDDLIMLCVMFNVDIDEIIKEIYERRGNMKYLKKIMDEKEARSLLYDISVFKAIKGRIYKKMRDIVEKELKPTDPILDDLQKLDKIIDEQKRKEILDERIKDEMEI